MRKILKVQLLPGGKAPEYAHQGDAGLDLFACEDAEIGPQMRGLCGAGIKIEIPDGCVGLIHPRSGKARDLGLTVLNTPGTIDSGYRGEIQVILYNSDKENAVKIAKGDKIAQLVIQEFESVDVEVVAELGGSDRGERGFGSSGI